MNSPSLSSPDAPSPAVAAAAISDRLVVALLFLSGAASLIDEHLLSRLLVRTVGSSAEAVAVVLVAFMGGMGLGARIAGRGLRASPRPWRRYGAIEIGIGLSSLALPITLSSWTLGYVLLAQHLGALETSNAAAPALLALRFSVAALVVSGPGVLMGMTFPWLMEAVRRSRGDALPLARFYAANTLGAATGVLLSTYVLVSCLGIYGTLLCAAACNLTVAAVALAADRGHSGNRGHRSDEREPASAIGATNSSTYEAPVLALPRGATLAFFSGLLAFAFEVIAFRLLAVIIGSSVYAFGLMLFVFLLGNAAGSRIATRRALGGLLWLSLCQSLVGLGILVTAPLWDEVPSLFRRIGAFAPNFVLWEGTRLFAALALLALPTVAMGAAFALVLRLAGGSDDKTPERVARLYGANMIGAIGGALLGTFVLAPALGSQAALLIVAVAEVALGALALTPAAGSRTLRLSVGGAFAAAAAVLLSLGSPWNPAALLSGANVYFSAGFSDYDQLRYLAEDRAGGMVAVVEKDGVRTLLSNGKFEGNDGFEVPDQQMFALLPLLFVRHYDAALNIGVGTGSSLSVMGAFPFAHLDAVDLSAAVLDAARGEFPHLNRGILDEPRVGVHVDDGRNFLLTARARYDLVVVQLTSIWINGSADLYSREFYRAARARLRDDGVLEQWIQLHHIDSLDVARAIATARSVFPHVTLWVAGHQGVLVASPGPLVADGPSLSAWSASPPLREILGTSKLDHPYAAFGHLYLDEPGIDEFLAEVCARRGLTVEELISTDERSTLEYSTPRGNLLPDALGDNMELLRRHASASALAHVEHLDAAHQRLLLGYAARERGFPRLARYLVGPVHEQFQESDPDLLRALDEQRGAPWP